MEEYVVRCMDYHPQQELSSPLVSDAGAQSSSLGTAELLTNEKQENKTPIPSMISTGRRMDAEWTSWSLIPIRDSW